MPSIIIVEKLGNIKETNVKAIEEADLYKKAGFKTADGFKCYAQWNIEELNDKSYSIYVYGKTTGRANQENKYEFPPPIDNTLFFGNCIVVNKVDDKIGSLTEAEWESIYEYLYGGFEDLGDDDDDDEDEEDDDPTLPRTKSGYVKDDFIVDDDEIEMEDEEEDDDYEEEEDDDEEEYVKKSSRSKKSAKKPATKSKSKKADTKSSKTSKKSEPMENIFTKVNRIQESESYLDCTSELSEEDYEE